MWNLESMSHVYGDHILSCLRLSHTLLHVHLPSLASLLLFLFTTTTPADRPLLHSATKVFKPFISKISPLSLPQHTKVMAGKNFLCIIEEMDRLWFHQVILFPSEPTASVISLPSPPDEEKLVHVPTSESVSCSSSILSSPPPPDDEISTDESPSDKQLSSEPIFVPLQYGSINNEEEATERLARMNRTHSHLSSPTTQNHHRKLRKPAISASKLSKSMSCRTLGELELDEVKGFMDLGFTFNKEYLSPRMMSVVPGLQRLGAMEDATETVRGNHIEAEEEKRDIMRPYLSEAWLIKRPDSPLLNLKIPKRCSSSNMKKHLRFWAKTVASEIHQE